MKSTIKVKEAEQAELMGWQEPGWAELLQGTGQDLEKTARSEKAILRDRKLNGAETLLRLVLAYAVNDWSLRLVGAWATIQKIAAVSDVALLYRFCHCQQWLGYLLGRVLGQRTSLLRELSGVRLRLVDATVVSRPGSHGTDWRVHLSFDLGRMCLDGIEVTTAQGGESLARFAPRSDEIYVGDRGYAFARGLGSLLASLARLVIRINWQSLPLQTDLGQRLHLIHWLQTLSCTTERWVFLTTPQGDFRVRLIASPLPPAQAQQARERLARQAKKKGKTLSPSAWLAAGFVLLITNLPAETWEASRVLYLYRLRWQIELAIKRLKSVLQLDHLRAQDPRLAQTYLLAKLLAAVWLDQLVQHSQQQQPALTPSLQRPLSRWRLEALLFEGLRHLINGCFSLDRIRAALPYLYRYLCDAPRARTQQLAWARRFLVRLSGV